METVDDGERDWGAHVRVGEGALDKVRSVDMWVGYEEMAIQTVMKYINGENMNKVVFYNNTPYCSCPAVRL